jgi:putative hydrolase of the HAD superfamily
MGRVKAVCFDFWETLFAFLTPQELEEVRGIRVKEFSRMLAVSPTAVENAFSQVIEDMNREREASGLEVPLHEVIRRVVATLGMDNAPLEELEEVYVKAVFERMPGPLPGALEVVDTLKRDGLGLAIISNTIHGRIEKELLKIYGMEGSFHVALFSSEVAYRKPRPEIFHMALRGMEVDPAQALHVGDTPVADVVGALGVGMRAVYFDMQGIGYPEELPKPHHIISRLTEVLELLN